jgi:hypothetical protein
MSSLVRAPELLNTTVQGGRCHRRRAQGCWICGRCASRTGRLAVDNASALTTAPAFAHKLHSLPSPSEKPEPQRLRPYRGDMYCDAGGDSRGSSQGLAGHFSPCLFANELSGWLRHGVAAFGRAGRSAPAWRSHAPTGWHLGPSCRRSELTPATQGRTAVAYRASVSRGSWWGFAYMEAFKCSDPFWESCAHTPSAIC